MLPYLSHAIHGVSGRARWLLLLLCAPAGLAAQLSGVSPSPSASTLPAPSDSASSRPALTLADLVVRLERSNPMLAASRAASDAARARVGPVRALPDPRAEFAVMNRMLPDLSTMSPLAMDQLTVTQMLPIAMRSAAVRAAEARSRAVATGVETQRFAVRREAAQMLADWWQADAARAVMDETRDLLRENATAAETMYRAGQARQADVLRMQAELTRMTAEWMSMDAMRRSAVASLSAMLDAPLNADALRPELPRAADQSTGAVSDGSSPDVAAAQRNVEASAAEEALARRERWPELEVGLQLGKRPNTNERMVGLMAGASLPIFARQRQQQMIEETIAMRRMAEADARNVAAENRAGMTEAKQAVDRARALQRLYDGTLLPQLHAVWESAGAAYRSGTGGIEATLEALMAMNSARIARLTAQADEVRALARLERLTGRAWLAVPLSTERHP